MVDGAAAALARDDFEAATAPFRLDANLAVRLSAFFTFALAGSMRLLRRLGVILFVKKKAAAFIIVAFFKLERKIIRSMSESNERNNFDRGEPSLRLFVMPTTACST
jgi:hypothetical protein